MMPLMYAILKDARADLEEASKRIDEGKRVVNEYSRMHNLNMYGKRAVNEYSRMHNINMYKGAELRNSIPHQSTDLLDGCRKLLERFKYAWDMMPLIYAILKDARADLDEASRRIDEGQYNNWYRHVIQTSMFVAFRANGPSSNGFFRTK
nr:unnamed protein product [Callosobruchus chinensis]